MRLAGVGTMGTVNARSAKPVTENRSRTGELFIPKQASREAYGLIKSELSAFEQKSKDVSENPGLVKNLGHNAKRYLNSLKASVEKQFAYDATKDEHAVGPSLMKGSANPIELQLPSNVKHRLASAEPMGNSHSGPEAFYVKTTLNYGSEKPEYLTKKRNLGGGIYKASDSPVDAEIEKRISDVLTFNGVPHLRTEGEPIKNRFALDAHPQKEAVQAFHEKWEKPQVLPAAQTKERASV